MFNPKKVKNFRWTGIDVGLRATAQFEYEGKLYGGCAVRCNEYEILPDGEVRIIDYDDDLHLYIVSYIAEMYHKTPEYKQRYSSK